MASRSVHPTLKRPPAGYKLLNQHRGGWSLIYISHDNHMVLKQSIQYDESPQLTDAHRRRGKDSSAFLDREKAIYRHLGSHEDILQVLEFRDDGLLFPYLPKGPLRAHLQANPLMPQAQRERWICTAVRSLAFVHSRDVLVADISTRNFLVTNDDGIVLSDFSGSGLQDLESMIRPDARYEKIDSSADGLPISMSTEIFAVGSLIYEIATGVEPYADLDEEEVATKFRSGVFPSTADVVFGVVMEGCWNGQYSTSTEVLHAVTTLCATNDA